MRLATVEPTQKRAMEPSAPPKAMSRYFCKRVPPSLCSIARALPTRHDLSGYWPGHDSATGFPVRSHHLSGLLEGTAVKGELLHLWSTLFSRALGVALSTAGWIVPAAATTQRFSFSAAIGNQSSLKPGKETYSFDVVGLLDERTLRRNRRFRSKPLFVMRITWLRTMMPDIQRPIWPPLPRIYPVISECATGDFPMQRFPLRLRFWQQRLLFCRCWDGKCWLTGTRPSMPR